MSDQIRAALREAAARIRDCMENKKPVPCNPTFMDADNQWWQIREWPTLGLTKSSTGPHGKRSKVKPSTSWAHDLIPEPYPTLAELLAAMEARAAQEDKR
jgi:hypothetical protein